MTAELQPVTVQTIAALPSKLRHALGLTAIDQDGWASRALLRALERRGLVQSYTDELFGTGDSPIDRIPVRVTRFRVPIQTHMAYCEWAATQPDDDS